MYISGERGKSDFEINPEAGRVSYAFFKRRIYTFQEAGDFLRTLPFRRPQNLLNILAPLDEGCGTCRHKHAILGMLSCENMHGEFRTVIEMYKDTSEHFGLAKQTIPYIPGCHAAIHHVAENGGLIRRFDFSKFNAPKVTPEILRIIYVQPFQLIRWKTRIHKAFIKRWLNQKGSSVRFEQIWEARENQIRKRQQFD
jgi:hypothetical protein